MPLSPTYLNRFHCLTFDLLNWLSIGCIYFSSTIYLPSLKLLWQSVLELSVARCYGRPTDVPTDRHVQSNLPSFFKGVPGFPQSLKSPWILGFPWKVLEKWFVLEKSLNLGDLPWNFQLVVLDFLFCVFWTESSNGYSKLRGTRANFSPQNSARFARSAAYKLNIFPVPHAHI